MARLRARLRCGSTKDPEPGLGGPAELTHRSTASSYAANNIPWEVEPVSYSTAARLQTNGQSFLPRRANSALPRISKIGPPLNHRPKRVVEKEFKPLGAAHL